MNKIFAPWTPEQVESLNRYQREGLGHPFTCEKRKMLHPYDGTETVLIATVKGWVCPEFHCDYTQNWAWDAMIKVGE